MSPEDELPEEYEQGEDDYYSSLDSDEPRYDFWGDYEFNSKEDVE